MPENRLEKLIGTETGEKLWKSSRLKPVLVTFYARFQRLAVDLALRKVKAEDPRHEEGELLQNLVRGVDLGCIKEAVRPASPESYNLLLIFTNLCAWMEKLRVIRKEKGFDDAEKMAEAAILRHQPMKKKRKPGAVESHPISIWTFLCKIIDEKQFAKMVDSSQIDEALSLIDSIGQAVSDMRAAVLVLVKAWEKNEFPESENPDLKKFLYTAMKKLLPYKKALEDLKPRLEEARNAMPASKLSLPVISWDIGPEVENMAHALLKGAGEIQMIYPIIGYITPDLLFQLLIAGNQYDLCLREAGGACQEALNDGLPIEEAIQMGMYVVYERFEEMGRLYGRFLNFVASDSGDYYGAITEFSDQKYGDCPVDPAALPPCSPFMFKGVTPNDPSMLLEAIFTKPEVNSLEKGLRLANRAIDAVTQDEQLKRTLLRRFRSALDAIIIVPNLRTVTTGAFVSVNSFLRGELHEIITREIQALAEAEIVPVPATSATQQPVVRKEPDSVVVDLAQIEVSANSPEATDAVSKHRNWTWMAAAAALAAAIGGFGVYELTRLSPAEEAAENWRAAADSASIPSVPKPAPESIPEKSPVSPTAETISTEISLVAIVPPKVPNNPVLLDFKYLEVPDKGKLKIVRRPVDCRSGCKAVSPVPESSDKFSVTREGGDEIVNCNFPHTKDEIAKILADGGNYTADCESVK